MESKVVSCDDCGRTARFDGTTLETLIKDARTAGWSFFNPKHPPAECSECAHTRKRNGCTKHRDEDEIAVSKKA